MAKLAELANVAVNSVDTFDHPTLGEFSDFVQTQQALCTAHIELTLRQCWSTLLDLEHGEIEAGSDLFDLGGHSLLANRLVAMASPVFGVDIKPLDIFENPTFAEQAGYLRMNVPSRYAPLMTALKDSWCELLDLEADVLNDNPDFFEQGGHSLLANRLIAPLNSRLGLSLTGLDVFENSGFMDFATCVLGKVSTAEAEALSLEEQSVEAEKEEQMDIVI